MITYHAILKGVSLLVGISFENRVRLDTASKVRSSALLAIKHKRIGGRKNPAETSTCRAKAARWIACAGHDGPRIGAHDGDALRISDRNNVCSHRVERAPSNWREGPLIALSEALDA